MTILDGLTFVKKAPTPMKSGGSVSPLDRAKRKLLAEVDAQIALANDPNFTIRKETKKRDGTTAISERKPKSWIVKDGEDAYITIRYSNKPMPLGGKRGSVIKCATTEIAKTLSAVREAIHGGHVDELIEKMMRDAKRKPRAQARTGAQDDLRGDGTY